MKMKIAIITGSNRIHSTSTQLAKYAGRLLTETGCDVTFINLCEQPLPFYDPNLEVITDEHVLRMLNAVKEADGVILCTPEYHGGITGVLKNALDYMGKEHFDGTVVLSMVSAGGAVGVSSLQQLQSTVRYVHGINCPEWVSIGGDQRKFRADGSPEFDHVSARVQKTVAYFVHMIKAFGS
jgi:azobenzene reductase